MNTRYYFMTIFAAAAMLTAGCSKFLDTGLDTDMTGDIINNNRHTLWPLAHAMYTPMQNGFTVLDNNFFAAASDEAEPTYESGAAFILNNGILNQDNVTWVTGIYRQYYEGIRACNFFIDHADRYGDDILKKDRDTIRDAVNYARDKRNLAWFKAEAHVARAYYYSELIQVFGGVPIVKEVFSSGTKPAPAPQKSYDEVVEYIVGEIDWCLDDLQENWLTHSDNLTSEIGRFDKKSALAIKSRVLLHAASPLHNPSGDVTKWERAAKAARDVIELMSYTMPPDRDYREAFLGNKAASSPETIFAMRLQASNNLERANYPIATPGGYSGVTPTHDLVKAYEYIGAGPEPSGISYADRDPRLTATVVVNGSIWNGREIDQSSEGRDNMANPNTSKTGYYLKKFLHDDINLIQNTSKEHVWIVFRYGEILLNYAEAMNMAFGPDATPAGYTKSARQALNEVRASASTHLPAVTVTVPADFHAAVKHERRIELAFEGHRYWDLLRWKDAETVLNRPVHGVTVEKIAPNYVYTEVEVADRVFGERHYFWPFSRAEIVNSKGTMSQNKGY